MSPATIAGPGRRGRRRRTPRVAGVGLLLLALVVAGGWFWLNRGRADVGVVAGDEQVMTERTAQGTFALPDGREIDVSADVGVETDGDTRAPRGGRLVEIYWGTSETTMMPVLERLTVKALQPVGLSVQAGGHSVELGDDVAEAGPESSSEPGVPQGLERRLLALPGDLDDLKVTLTYAGRSQSVELFTGRRDVGSFRALYRDADPRIANDLDTRIEESGEGLVWTSWVDATGWRTPYLEGRGWAPEGREWVVVATPQLWLMGILTEDGDTEYRRVPRRMATGTVSASGARLLQPRQISTLAEDQEFVEGGRFPDVVLDAPSGAPVQVRLTLRTELEPRRDDGPLRTATFTRSFEIPAAVDLA